MVSSVSMVCSNKQKDLKAFEQKAIWLIDASEIESFDEDKKITSNLFEMNLI